MIVSLTVTVVVSSGGMLVCFSSGLLIVCLRKTAVFCPVSVVNTCGVLVEQ